MAKRIPYLLLLLLLIPYVSTFLVRGILLPWNDIAAHPQQTNREVWLEHLGSSPIGKLFNLYKQMDDVGIDFSEFDLIQRPLVLNDNHI